MSRTLLTLQHPSELFRTLLTMMRVLKTEFTYLLLIEPCILDHDSSNYINICSFGAKKERPADQKVSGSGIKLLIYCWIIWINCFHDLSIFIQSVTWESNDNLLIIMTIMTSIQLIAGSISLRRRISLRKVTYSATISDYQRCSISDAHQWLISVTHRRLLVTNSATISDTSVMHQWCIN